jgi:phosphatidylserine decarboxylase
VFFILVLLFFRCPERILSECEDLVYAPADGKIVVIKDTLEDEYFKDRRKQVSIFMSPINVHVNRYPIKGTVTYYKYHPGKYLVAWHPKSSLKNERATTVLENPQGKSILVRQIAGAVARRIVNYSNVGKTVQQGDELGFIKFGSRVDLFLPVHADIKVSLNEKVFGNRTIIAKI